MPRIKYHDDRLEKITAALAAVPEDRAGLVSAVLDVLRTHKVSYTEFAKLDGRDNAPGVPDWHWKLRATRNSSRSSELFAILAGRV